MQQQSSSENNYFPEKQALRKTCSRIGWMCFSTNLLVAWLASGVTLLFLLAGYPFGIYPDSIAGYQPHLYYALTCAIYLFCLLVPMGIYLAANRISWSVAAPHQKNGAFVFWCCVILGLSICLLGTLPTDFTGWLMEQMRLREPTYAGGSPFGDDISINLLSIFSSTVIPAFSEELFFRGLILGRLKKYGNIFAVLISSLLFSLYHAAMPQMIFTFIMGLALGLIMIRIQNIWAVMLIHALTNGIDLLNSYLSSALGYTIGIVVRYSIITFFVLLGILCIFLLAKKHHGFFQRRKPITHLKVSTKIGVFLFNPGIIVMAIGLIGMEIYHWLR